jgi:hypothetical protein
MTKAPIVMFGQATDTIASTPRTISGARSDIEDPVTLVAESCRSRLEAVTPRGGRTMSSRTKVTPGAAHAASIASSCSAHERTVPAIVTVPFKLAMERVRR